MNSHSHLPLPASLHKILPFIFYCLQISVGNQPQLAGSLPGGSISTQYTIRQYIYQSKIHYQNQKEKPSTNVEPRCRLGDNVKKKRSSRRGGALGVVDFNHPSTPPRCETSSQTFQGGDLERWLIVFLVFGVSELPISTFCGACDRECASSEALGLERLLSRQLWLVWCLSDAVEKVQE